MSGRPLESIRILSLAEQYPGPYGTLLLSDLGADVVLVERPTGGDPSRQFPAFFEALNRGKRSITLDLKDETGKEAFLSLVDGADVVLEGFRPGTMERLGLGYDVLTKRRPQLIYVSISGFGQESPYRDRPAHDVSYQAIAGLLFEQVRAEKAGPAPTLALGDLSAGLFATVGVLVALCDRARTGLGTHVDVAMTDGLVSLLTAHLVPIVNEMGAPAFPHQPGYRTYRTGDGHLVALSAAHEDSFWDNLCRALDLTDLADIRAPERLARHDELVEHLTSRIAGRDRKTLDEVFKTYDIPFGWANDLTDVPNDPHVRARHLFVQVLADDSQPDHWHIRQPLRLGGESPAPTRHAPKLGEHTREILAEIGLTDEPSRYSISDRSD